MIYDDSRPPLRRTGAERGQNRHTSERRAMYTASRGTAPSFRPREFRACRTAMFTAPIAPAHKPSPPALPSRRGQPTLLNEFTADLPDSQPTGVPFTTKNTSRSPACRAKHQQTCTLYSRRPHAQTRAYGTACRSNARNRYARSSRMPCWRRKAHRPAAFFAARGNKCHEIREARGQAGNDRRARRAAR